MPRARTICCEPGCPEFVAYRGRCTEHARDRGRYERKTVPTKIDMQKTAKRRSLAVQRWRDIYGDWCPGYKRYGHKASDLTAQHTHALALEGDVEQSLTVLCRSCNSRHSADVRRAINTRYDTPPGGRPWGRIGSSRG